jgi:hypothetical protein
MNLRKPILLSGLCLLGTLVAHHAIAFEHVVKKIGIEKIEAQELSFEQTHLCPYPIELNVKIFNELKIAGLKKFSYRWLMNDQIIKNNGRFDAYPSAYGVGYDVQKIIVHVGHDVNAGVQEKESAMTKMMNVFKSETKIANQVSEGWYQFLVLPAGETNWADAVKSNKAHYQINCKS